MEKEKTLSVTHKDIVITYDEYKDRWLFNLRGKDRSADSLANAKKAIDAPPPKDEKPFRRFEAWHRTGYGSAAARVTVTSITENGRFWITTTGRRGAKERAQAGASELFACGPENDAVVARLEAKDKEINTLRAQAEDIRKELRHVEPKDWEER